MLTLLASLPVSDGRHSTLTSGGLIVEKITVAPPPASATAPASRASRVRGTDRLGGVSIVRQGTCEFSPMRGVWVRVLLSVFVRARSRARGMSRYGVGMRSRWRRATFR